MKKQKLAVILTTLILIFMFVSVSYSAEIAGEVLAVKNNAYLIRDNARNNAAKQMDLFMKDAVETGKYSRTKLFFHDDSILNLGELSKVEVQEYMYNADKKRSKSIYKLIDGSLRVVVGRSDLEVHTSTAVAAARGTKFIIWNEGSITSAKNTKTQDSNLSADKGITSGIYLAVGKEKTSSTCITVLGGKVELRNLDPNVKGKLMVDEGNTACVTMDAPPALSADKGVPELYVLGLPEDVLPALAPLPTPFHDPDLPDIPQEPDLPPAISTVDVEVVFP